MCITIQGQTATSHQPFHPGLCVSLSRGRLPPVINHSTLTYVCHYPGADCHQSSTIPPWPMCVTIQGQTATSHQPFYPGLCVSLSRGRLPPVINHSTLTYVCHYPGADCHQSSTIPSWPMCATIQGQTATSHQPFHPGLCVSLSRGRLPPVTNHSTLAYVCHYPGADCHQSSTIPPCHYPGADCHQSSTIPSWPMCVTIQVQTATSHQPFHPDLCVCHYPGADCHQSSTIPPWPMCVTIQGQTATSPQPFHPGLCVSLSRGRLPPVLNHSILVYVCHYPGADCHQSSTIPSWSMCVTIQGQTATSHQPFHPDLCVSLSRGRLPPVINHSTLTYVCHYPGADCHQSSTIPSWSMCVTIQVQTATSHQPFHPDLCVTIQGQTATSHQPFHPGLCVPLSRGRLPSVINHSTLAYVCHYPGADCHQSSTIPPWPMCVTIQGQTATSHQPFHPGLCVPLSRGRLPPVINHSTLAYVCHYPGTDCHQSSTIPPWPMCVTIQGQTATSHQPFHPGLCGSLSRDRLPPVINHSTLAYVCHYPGADCHQSSTILPWPMCVTIQDPLYIYIPSEVDSAIFETAHTVHILFSIVSRNVIQNTVSAKQFSN